MIITPEMVACFRDASHDTNPLHTDAEYARRTPFGQPLVYGVLVALHGIAIWSEGRPLRLKQVYAVFKKPVMVNTEYGINWLVRNGKHHISIFRGTVEYVQIRLELDSLLPLEETAVHGASYTVDEASLRKLLSVIGFHDNMILGQAAALLWSSYWVGRVDPGEKALFSELDFHFSAAYSGLTIEMDVESSAFDERFNRTTLEGKGTAVSGFRLAAFKRPEPVGLDWQKCMTAATEVGDWKGKRVLVTGAGRGFGASLVAVAGLSGAEPIIQYRSYRAEIQELQSKLSLEGVSSRLLQADLLDAREVDKIAQDQSLEGGIDLLILNATPPIYQALFTEQGPKDFKEFFDKSFLMTFNALSALLPHVNEGGSVVLISTEYLDNPPAGFSHYLSAKAAQEALLESLSKEHGTLSFLSARLPRMRTDQTNMPFDSSSTAQTASVAAELLRTLLLSWGGTGYSRIQIELDEGV